MGRRLGQHFLSDVRILDRIADAIDPKPGDRILEIGPGQGTLSDRLLLRVPHLVAIERDQALAAALGDRLGDDKARVVVADALEEDWARLVGVEPNEAFKVIGNIPYYISTPLVDKALSYPTVEVVVYLVQEEVASRMAAEPGSKAYGGLSVGVQVFSEVERLFPVKAGSFRPPPKVDSAVVRLTPRPLPLVPPEDRAAFRSFVTKLFTRRRKQLIGSLGWAAGLDRGQTGELLTSMDIDPTARVERISPFQLAETFERLPQR